MNEWKEESCSVRCSDGKEVVLTRFSNNAKVRLMLRDKTGQSLGHTWLSEEEINGLCVFLGVELDD